MIKKYQPTNEEERKFLENYDPNKYEKPSVTADIVIFTLDEENNLCVLLIQRGGFPYKGKWAIPGGFVGMSEDIDTAAARELKEETNLENIPIEQFGTFGEVNRDPRMRVISIAYMAFVPKNSLAIQAGDDAQDAQIFKITYENEKIVLINNKNIIKEKDLAFDHNNILRVALRRLRNRIDYTNDAFKFLKNDQAFSIYEVKKIFETVTGTTEEPANFRRDFIRKYVNSKDNGVIVEKINGTTTDHSKRGAQLYRVKEWLQ